MLPPMAFVVLFVIFGFPISQLIVLVYMVLWSVPLVIPTNFSLFSQVYFKKPTNTIKRQLSHKETRNLKVKQLWSRCSYVPLDANLVGQAQIFRSCFNATRVSLTVIALRPPAFVNTLGLPWQLSHVWEDRSEGKDIHLIF